MTDRILNEVIRRGGRARRPRPSHHGSALRVAPRPELVGGSSSALTLTIAEIGRFPGPVLLVPRNKARLSRRIRIGCVANPIHVSDFRRWLIWLDRRLKRCHLTDVDLKRGHVFSFSWLGRPT